MREEHGIEGVKLHVFGPNTTTLRHEMQGTTEGVSVLGDIPDNNLLKMYRVCLMPYVLGASRTAEKQLGCLHEFVPISGTLGSAEGLYGTSWDSLGHIRET